LGLTWSAGSNGGSTIIDYRISSAVSGGSYSVLSTDTSTTSYQATSLTAGVTYDFKVEARTVYGYSSEASLLNLLCATIAAVPTSVATSIVGSTVKIEWSLTTTNGAAISAYKVYIS